ncbi:hypothetical protein [Confluentibacter sediminis]|uniref:hypothetical protein n=1 Tax=Confluentibacter sediminis TaxID=2219045 RepID=UPI000DAE9853|nr:hypothetical protein [Confluentibacter sediminis]
MSKEKLIKVLNRIQYSIKENYLNKVKETDTIGFEELTSIRNQFIQESFANYQNEYENEFIDNLNKDNTELLSKIQVFVTREIYKLAYDEKWNIA